MGEAEMLEKMAQMEKDAGMLKDAEEKVAKLSKENADLASKLSAMEDNCGDATDQLDADLADAAKDYEELEAKHNKLKADHKKLEGDGANLADELATAGENIAKLEKDKQGLDLKVKGLTSDLE